MAEERELIKKLGRKLTDRVDVVIGKTKLDENSPEYYGFASVVTDEMAEVALAMKKRVPMTLDEVAKRCGKPVDLTERLLQEMSVIGLIEYNWENADRHKQYVLPMFVPGCAEFMNMNKEQVEAHPEVSEMFYNMSLMPLSKLTPMIPLGGAGVGMHVIPVEKAIETEQHSADVEHISHWLEKYKDGRFGVGACSCRRSRRLRGEGCGHLEEDMCIALGDMADYCVETGKGRYCTYEEVLQILKRAEDNGLVHEITNIDGEDKIFAICNCCVCSCYALRTSQLFNTPNMSRSAYVAHVDPKNCVACGRCVEFCPSGAVKLGQKLCTKDGPIQYPKQELPDAVKWGPEKWNENYRDDNQINCYDTGTAPCKSACPAHIAVQGYIKMASQGRYKEALALIKRENPFPAVCGHICNRRCESECTRGEIDQALAIDEIKKFIAEQDLKAETRYVPPMVNQTGKPFEEKIAVIGAGPAGMSCAYYLAEKGYPVTVFDRNKAPGGMLTMGIPEFRLEKKVVKAEIEILREMGVKFKCGVDVGKDVTIPELRAQGYKGFYIAIGAQKSAPIGIPGEELSGVLGGVEFLREVNSGKKPEVGEAVAVIGGGNVSVDVARSAIRLGAKNVYLIYRRGRDEIKADEEELSDAVAEGMELKLLRAPAEIEGKNGKVTAVMLEIMELGEPDASGRRAPVGTGKFEFVKVSTVIGAIGQRMDWGDLLKDTRVELTRKGTAVCDPLTYQTGEPDIFVGGDAVTGPKFAIDAIAAGKEAAVSLHRAVHAGQSLTIGRNRREFPEMDKMSAAVPVESFDAPARQVPAAYDPAKAKKTFRDLRSTFTEEQVKAETSRCLGCGASVVDENKCIGCGICTTKCDFDAIHLFREHPEASKMYTSEDKMKAILPYMVQREIKIKRAERKNK